MADRYDDLFEGGSEPTTREALTVTDHDSSGATGALAIESGSLKLEAVTAYDATELGLRATIDNHTGLTVTLGGIELVLRDGDGKPLDVEQSWKDVKFATRQELIHDMTLKPGALTRLGRIDLWIEWESTFRFQLAHASVTPASSRRIKAEQHDEPWPCALAAAGAARAAWLPAHEVLALVGYHGRSYDSRNVRLLLELDAAPGGLDAQHELVAALRDADGRVLKKESATAQLPGGLQLVKFDFYEIGAAEIERTRSVDVVAKATLRRRERVLSCAVQRGASAPGRNGAKSRHSR